MTSTFEKAPSHTLWTSSEAAKATSGTTTGDWFATGVSIDSRSIEKNDLFIALIGDNGDGHQFVKNALDKGASAAIVSRMIDGVSPDRLLIVEDTFKALQDLGRAARTRTGAKIIGVTGSVGKTGTKEMLGRAFSQFGQTSWSVKSFNNHWGVPLSLARMHAGSDFGIFEMGMNHADEITPLTQMVKPDIAIITTVAPVHAGNFSDGVAGIARAKAEIFAGLKPDGVAILNRDNEYFDFLVAEAKKHGVQKILSFGEHENADARLVDTLVASNGVRVTANILGQEIIFILKDAGHHIAMNALSVLLAVKLAGQDVAKAAKELEQIEPPSGRGKREFLDIGDASNPVTLIDESYNASPVAMQAAFKVLALIDPGRNGRRVAILGDMLELGNDGPRLHADLALPLKAANIDLVYTCGTLMKNLHDALPNDNRKFHAKDSVELGQIVPEVLVPGDVVMVKGSFGSKMNVVVEALRALPAKKRASNGAKGINNAV